MSKTEILAYTCCYGDRGQLTELVSEIRSTAGCWFNWLVCVGAPSKRLHDEADTLLNDPERMGIQYLREWEENRGQHHATALALEIARREDYKWLLRLDDDVKVRTKGWLEKMVSRLEELKDFAGDGYYRLVAAPRIIGLKNLIHPEGNLDKGQKYPVEVMPILGGVCRLHPVELLEGYAPPLYDPVGRGDPESIVRHVTPTRIGTADAEDKGLLVRFPDIRLLHRTKDLEAEDTKEQARMRTMSHYWPWLGADV